uniref:Family with sequence similarity 219 member A n=1 Tax=Anolis carolinensis TaxID=28377 RepID=A0A803TN75_ANOCA
CSLVSSKSKTYLHFLTALLPIVLKSIQTLFRSFVIFKSKGIVCYFLIPCLLNVCFRHDLCNTVFFPFRLVVPNKGYSSLDQSPDEKPLVALDTDSDDDFDMSRYSSSGYSSAEQINQDLNIQLLKDGYRLDEIPDDEDLDLIPPKSVNPTCMCCQATSSTACHIQ